jgi:hypothetical protein
MIPAVGMPQSRKSLGKAYLFTALNMSIPIVSGAALESYSESGSVSGLGTALYLYGFSLAPITGNLYFGDNKRLLTGATVGAAAGGLFFLSREIALNNLFSSTGGRGEYYLAGYYGMGLGVLAMLANSVYGIVSVPKSKELYFSRIAPSVSLMRESGGSVLHFDLSYAL